MISSCISYAPVSYLNIVLLHQLFLYLFREFPVMYIHDAGNLKHTLWVHVLPESFHNCLIKKKIALVVYLLDGPQH